MRWGRQSRFKVRPAMLPALLGSALPRWGERMSPGGRSRRDQAPTTGQSWAVSGANEHIVVHIPNHRLTGAHIVKDEIRMAIAIKVSGCYQFPSIGQRRTVIGGEKPRSR